MTTYAGTEPSQPAIPTTEIESGTPTSVTISWTPPGDEGGISVSSYQILFLQTDTTYSEKSSCDGTDTTIRDS